MRIALALFLIGFAANAAAQNLVPNPSFEEYLECPYSTAEFQTQVVDWYSFSYTPDYFHVCSNDLEGYAGVPDNVLGNEWPVLGEAYSAIYTYSHTGSNLREYMAAQLQAPLEIGEEYYIMFYASFYDGGVEYDSWCATNHLGIRFFKDPNYSTQNPLQADNIVHLDYNESFTDASGWRKIEGWFTADDNYNWVSVGNFFTDDQTDTIILNPDNRCFAIYYIDNICVGSSEKDCNGLVSLEEVKSQSEITVYPNPTADFVRLLSSEDFIQEIELSDLNGQILISEQYNKKKARVDLSKFEKGLYILVVRTGGEIQTFKIQKL